MSDVLQGVIPVEKNWELEGVMFKQRPLSLNRSGQLIGLIGGTAFSASNNAVAKTDEALLAAVLMEMRKDKNVLANLLEILLDAETAEQLEATRKIGLKDAILVIREALKQNDIEEIKKDFLALWEEIQTSLGNAKQSKKTS